MAVGSVTLQNFLRTTARLSGTDWPPGTALLGFGFPVRNSEQVKLHSGPKPPHGVIFECRLQKQTFRTQTERVRIKPSLKFRGGDNGSDCFRPLV